MRVPSWALLLALSAATISCGEEEPCRVEYGDCDEVEGCADGAGCHDLSWRDGEGSICGRECDDELDCPSDGGNLPRCLDVDSSGRFYCYPECNRYGESCPEGWVCQPISSPVGAGSVCLP